MRADLAWGRGALCVVAAWVLGGCPPNTTKDAGTGEEICLVQADCEDGLFCYLGKCVTEIPRPDASAADAALPPDAAVLRDAAVADAARPDAARPDTGSQDAWQPDTGVPDAGRPDTGRPDAGRPDGAQPRDAAVTDRGECYCSGRQTCDQDAGGCQEPTICVEDLDCLAGRFCVWGRCVDQEPECRLDSQCGPGGYCVQEVLECRPPTCAGDTDCPSTEVCRGTTCKQCRDANQCPGNQQCSSEGVCIESGSCLSDDDCLAPRRCEGTACEDPDCSALSADCPSGAWCDPFEPNNDLSNLPPLNPGTHRVTLCHGDEDWFFLATVPGDGVLAQATLLDPVVGAAVWELFDQDGMMLAESRRDGRTLTLGYGRAEDTTAFLRLASLDGFLQRVELYVEFVPGGFCTPDRWEPNDFRQEAVAVTPTSVGQGDGPAFTLCPGDEDWFKGSVLPGKTLTVTLLTEDGAGPAVALYGGVNPVLRSLDTALDATKVLTVTDPINFFVHVYRQDPTVGEHAALLFHVNN